MQKKPNILDATDLPLGRLASAIAIVLQGKDDPSYRPHLIGGGSVVVQHADKVKLTGKKLDQKVYIHASGYPGGLKKKPVKDLLRDKPEEVIRRAVWNMLPKNKLRAQRIKRLTFTS